MLTDEWNWDEYFDVVREEAMEQGIERGMEKGRSEGREEGTLEIARNLKKMGLPVSQIADGTGLPSETIEQL